MLGIKDTHAEIIEIAFKALRDGLPAMKDILANPQYSEYLISQVL